MKKMLEKLKRPNNFKLTVGDLCFINLPFCEYAYDSDELDGLTMLVSIVTGIDRGERICLCTMAAEDYGNVSFVPSPSRGIEIHRKSKGLRTVLTIPQIVGIFDAMEDGRTLTVFIEDLEVELSIHMVNVVFPPDRLRKELLTVLGYKLMDLRKWPATGLYDWHVNHPFYCTSTADHFEINDRRRRNVHEVTKDVFILEAQRHLCFRDNPDYDKQFDGMKMGVQLVEELQPENVREDIPMMIMEHIINMLRGVRMQIAIPDMGPEVAVIASFVNVSPKEITVHSTVDWPGGNESFMLRLTPKVLNWDILMGRLPENANELFNSMHLTMEIFSGMNDYFQHQASENAREWYMRTLENRRGFGIADLLRYENIRR